MNPFRPIYQQRFTKDNARHYLHHAFNQEHHSDVRSERHSYVNRFCLMNTIDGMLVELTRKRAVLEEDENHQTNTEYHDIVKRIARLEKDKSILQKDRELHLPHYALVSLAAAFADGLPFRPEDDGNGWYVWEAAHGMSKLPEALALKLINDASIADKFGALDNMVENLKSDAARAHDSLDRLVSTDWETLKWQIANPDALYAVLIQPPPQTGSAAIRGQQETPTDGSTS